MRDMLKETIKANELDGNGDPQMRIMTGIFQAKKMQPDGSPFVAGDYFMIDKLGNGLIQYHPISIDANGQITPRDIPQLSGLMLLHAFKQFCEPINITKGKIELNAFCNAHNTYQI